MKLGPEHSVMRAGCIRKIPSHPEDSNSLSVLGHEPRHFILVVKLSAILTDTLSGKGHGDRHEDNARTE